MTTVPLIDLKDLDLGIMYDVIGYRKCRGSCGIYYLIQVDKRGTSETCNVKIYPDNNVYDHLVNKTSTNKFSIKRVVNLINDAYVIVNSSDDWIELH